MKKRKNYKRRSKIFRLIGQLTIGLFTVSGFIIYESIIDWSNLKQDIENFIVVNQQSIKLNFGIAFPFLIALIVFLFVMLKKNREFFKDKVSFNLLMTIIVLYLFYSVVEATLCALIGALCGSLLDEIIFNPLSKSAKIKANEQHEFELEEEREKRRIKARRKAREELDGSV